MTDVTFPYSQLGMLNLNDDYRFTKNKKKKFKNVRTLYEHTHPHTHT